MMAKRTVTRSTKFEQSFKLEIEWGDGENVVEKLKDLGMSHLPAIIDNAVGGSNDYSLVSAEHAAVMVALRATNGHITKAAKLLGVTRTTLYDKIKKYSIEVKRSVSISQRDNSDVQ